MENDEIFKSLLSKIESKYNLNESKKLILYNWYEKQFHLLNDFLDSKNEITNNSDKIKLLYILYQNEVKEKNKNKELKKKDNYFRRTLKKKIDL